jgi:putative transposase
MIVGWRVAGDMRTTMVLDAIEMARWSRGNTLSGLRCHSDAGSQFTSIRYGERLAEIGAVPSIGTVGDSYYVVAVLARTVLRFCFSTSANSSMRSA